MSTGLNADRLANIDRFLQERYVGPGRLPGAITLVQRRGKLACARKGRVGGSSGRAARIRVVGRSATDWCGGPSFVPRADSRSMSTPRAMRSSALWT